MQDHARSQPTVQRSSWLQPAALRHCFCAQGPLLLRIAAASVGGYALAALFSIAVLALPGAAIDNVLWGMMGSFLVWSGVVLWTFAASTARQALYGLGGVALVLLVPAAWVTRLSWSA